MKNKKTFLSAFLSLITTVIFIVIILIDKPDYHFFNFIYKNIVPISQNIGQFVSYPIRLIGKVSNSIKSSKSIEKENEEMKVKLADFERISTENELLRQENDLLQQKLKMPTMLKNKTVFGRIIHDNSFFATQSFIIKINDKDVSVGNIVLSNNGYLLGIITEKMGSFAKIQSVTDTKSNIPVRIAGTDVFGFLQGDGFSEPKLRFLSDGDFKPDPEMLLITSGVKGNIPNNIPVGKISKIKNDQINVKLGSELKKQESAVILLFDKNSIYE